jgi:threonine dehydrogenase-like Zn-dependent dehydrogenase
MQALSFPSYGRVEIIELPRPALRDPGDAIVLVTTAAIGPWDVEHFLGVGGDSVVPGGEFAGIVVETGANVSTLELDDLVANTTCHTGSSGQSDLFGSTALPGGHAEYVRVPDADTTLTKISASGEERAVLAGGSVGLGVNVATAALASSEDGSIAVVGCDPIGMTALIALKNSGMSDRLLAVEDHAVRNTLASGFAPITLTSSQIRPENPKNKVDTVIVGSILEYPGFESVARLVKSSGSVIFSEPYGAARVTEQGMVLPRGVVISTASWPTNEDARKIVTAIQIRRLDLTPLVSHVFPFDEAQEAYEAASEPGSGVQKVLLKP